MYASLLISLLAAFVAMLGKQWLNRYSRNSGGSIIERCGDRQRKCDGLEKWPLHFFVESLPVMLQVSLLLLACGLCRHMWSINSSVAFTLVSLTGLGAAFYLVIVIAGMSSYACPLQTPASVALRGLWKKVRRGIVTLTVHCTRVLSRARRMWAWRVRSLLRRQTLPTTIPLENVQAHPSGPRMKRKNFPIIHRTNTDDVRCVSWILRNITDPEVLDAAIRLAGTIRWFDDGINVNPPYNLIASTFKACFDHSEKLYPGSRDRAYYAGRAMVWIHTLAGCKSKESASTFPLLHVGGTKPAPDTDLRHLLRVNSGAWEANCFIQHLLETNPDHTPPHSQWISDVLLHYCWANQTELDYPYLLYSISRMHKPKITLPLNTTLNRLLVWCIFLGSPVEGEVLNVQDKSYDISCFCSKLLTTRHQ